MRNTDTEAAQILVVDDNEANRLLARHTLERERRRRVRTNFGLRFARGS